MEINYTQLHGLEIQRNSLPIRDYEVYNQNNELVIIGTSKWVLVNTTTGKLRPIPEEIN